MLWRFLILATVLFWGTMWTLLIRTELRPHTASWREVSVEHVLKRVFQHGTDSDLVIRTDGSRLGHVRISPRLGSDNGNRLLRLNGDLHLRLPNAPRQRIGWDGEIEMDGAGEFTRLDVTVTAREQGQRAEEGANIRLVIDRSAGRGTYRWAVGGNAIEETFTLDQAGLRAVLARAGLDPLLLTGVPAGAMAPPQVVAQQSSLAVQGERLETWLVSMRQGAQPLLEMHISQLGQVVHAKTIFGWTLEPE